MLTNMSMDSEQHTPLSISEVQCCSCECACSTLNRSNSGAWLRKFQESNVAMVEMENECFMLREMVKNQQERIDNLSVELEEERNASSSSANEAMSMILRLQREKAEVQMEFRQYKRFVEEKIVHDGEEILALEELLYKREQVIESLTCDMETYKHRRMNFGLADVEAEGEKVVISQNNGNDYWEAEHDIPTYDYPCTECNSYENQLTYEVNNDVVEVEKHVFGEPLQSQGQFEDLEYRIKQLDESFTHSQPDVELFGTNNVLEKVIVSHSPRYRHVRRSSNDNSSSNYLSVKLETTDLASDVGSAEKKECVHVHLEENSNSKRVDTTSELGDGMSDRLHTVDSGQHVPYNSVTEQKATVGIRQNYMTTQKEPLHMENFGDQDIKKLYMRLQVLEADRESMRQALISIGIEKARLVLLKEIAQQLCQNMSFAKTLPVRKTSVSRIFSIFKWILSFILWRKKARQCRYIFGMSAHNIELLALLDKGARLRRWRSILSTKV